MNIFFATFTRLPVHVLLQLTVFTSASCFISYPNEITPAISFFQEYLYFSLIVISSKYILVRYYNIHVSSFYHHYSFGCPKANFGLLTTQGSLSTDANHSLYCKFDPKGHIRCVLNREPFYSECIALTKCIFNHPKFILLGNTEFYPLI